MILLTFIRGSDVNLYYKASFADMIYGKAYKPFVYRVLLPVTVRIITSAIPSKSRTFLNQMLENDQLVKNLLYKFQFRAKQEYLIESGITLILMYLSLLGFVFGMRYFLQGIFLAPRIFEDIVLLIALCGLLPFFAKGYIYDFSTLFLFTLGLGLMVRAKWWPFLFVFLMACLNKETTILLTMIFIIHFHNEERMNRLLFKRLLLSQLFIFLFIKLWLFLTFRSNPGTFLEFHLVDNTKILLKPYPLIITVFIWIAVALLVFYKWRDKPNFLRHGIWIIVPLFLLSLFFGLLYEVRVYYEVYPIFILLSCHTVGKILGIKVTNFEKNKLCFKGR
jgi:hypothetical protein